MTASGRRRLLSMLTVAWVGAASGCSDELTQIIVVVDTDMRVPTELDQIDIELDHGGATQMRTTSLGVPGSPSLPLALTVLPRANDASLTVTVTGRLASASLVTRRVRTRFMAGQSRLLHVLLVRSCVGAACAVDQSCGPAACQSIDVETVPWSGTPPTFDGGPPPVLPPMPGMPLQISAGAQHACAADASGHVWCWGRNDLGQLGDGTTVTVRNRPTYVRGADDVQQVAAGDFHTCARRATGEVLCWGRGADGELGTASEGSASPVQVAGLGSASAIATGGGHSCALDSAGAVRCWGSNEYGELGATAGAPSATPVRVSLPAAATAVATGRDSSCAIVSGSTPGLYCWGRNDRGQLGDGTTTSSASPVHAGLSGAVALVAVGAFHTCAVAGASRTVWCWGFSGSGRLGLGDGSPTQVVSPMEVAGLMDVTALATGDSHTCAVIGGDVRCWGANGSGQLGDGSMTDRSSPVAVVEVTQRIDVAAGVAFSCARRSNGPISCWGDNSSGQLGDGSGLAGSPRPRLVALAF